MAQGLYDVVTDAAVEHAMTDRVSKSKAKNFGLERRRSAPRRKEKKLG